MSPNILAHLAQVAGQGRFMAGREGAAPSQCREGGEWVSVAPRPVSSRPGPREREQRGDSYQFRVSWAGLEEWGVWPVTGHQWPLQPQRVTSDRDRPALRSPGREASIRDVGTFRLRVTPASAQGEQRYHGQWPVARVSSEGSPEPSEGTLQLYSLH